MEETKKEKKVGREGGREGKGRERKTEGGSKERRKGLDVLRTKKIIFQFKDSHPISQKRECDAFQNS